MEPVCCRFCRREEPSAWLLGNNHGWRTGAGICLSQHLRRNHLIAVTRGATKAEQIEEYIDRAIEAWRDQLDPELLAAARARVRQMRGGVTPPEHRPIPATEEMSLW